MPACTRKESVMSKTPSGSHRNLSLDDRISIQRFLDQSLNYKEIAGLVGVHPKTISREVKNRRYAKVKDSSLRKRPCAFLKTCTLVDLCDNRYCTHTKVCAKCKQRTCSQYCDHYVHGTCPKLLKPPYVCNGCDTPRCDKYDKMYYRAKYSDDHYHENMSESRKGVNLSPEDLHELDALVTPLVKRGQSIAHIYATHKEEIGCAKRTLYQYVNDNLLTARNLDLPRKVKYKPRRKRIEPAPNQNYKKGRSYKEFLLYIEENPELSIVEMDTVIGEHGGKVFLTMLFRNCSFMLIFLMADNTQASVINVFDILQEKLGIEKFKKIFPIILTDNGSEFKNPFSLEADEWGEIRTKVYYCDSHKSCQKGRIEKNHVFIREIIATGNSFNGFIQEDATLMANHINSVARASLNEKTPFELATMLLDPTLLKALELHAIQHDEVLLKPRLIKH